MYLSFLQRFAILFAWLLFIVVLLLTPMPFDNAQESTTFIDKIVHAFLFGIFAFLVFYLFKAVEESRLILNPEKTIPKEDIKKHKKGGYIKFNRLLGIFLISFFTSTSLSIVLEYVQVYVPGRSPNDYDLLSSVVGIVLVLIFIYGNNYKKRMPKLLLHICCAGCGAFVSQTLKENYDISLFYYNPNIHPESEYTKREDEVKIIAQKYNLPLIIEDYHHDKWLDNVRGLEQEPEKGKRCYKCYEYRMKKVAQKASAMNFDFFSTTLSVSPFKIYRYIKEIGDDLAKKYSIGFHDQDYKKKDGFKKASKLSQELNLYRQNYCGCEFSRN